MRGHGRSSSSNDFNFVSLVDDVVEVIKKVVKGSEKMIEVFLVGHSLGAAVLAALPDQFKETKNIKFSGLVMVDIIEGNKLFEIDCNVSIFYLETAINSLSRMPTIIKDIPKSFNSIEIALKWNLSSSHSHHNSKASSKQIEAIKTSLTSQLAYNEQSSSYEWITDLSLLEPYWNNWFTGLTQNFLKFPGSRLLILADTDYMDREMIVAQMQGRFQLAIVRESGHAIQEDQPEELAEIVIGMIHKHLKLSQLLHNK